MSLFERSRPLVEVKRAQLCEPCHLDNQEIKATAWCTFCTEAMCEKCTSTHKRLKKKIHTLVPIEEMRKQQLPEVEQDEPCFKHPGKIYEVYCVDHRELCCVICLATQHRKCEHITTFEEMIKSPENAKSLKHFITCLTKIDEKASGLVTKTEENINRLEHKRSEISEQVSSTIQQARYDLDKLQARFQEKFQQMHKVENGQLEDRKERVKVFLNKVRKGQKLLDVVSKHGTAKQLFITQEKLKAQLKDQKQILQEDLKGAKLIDYTFKMNDIKIPFTTGSPLDSIAVIDVKSTLDLTGYLNEVVDLVDSVSDLVESASDIKSTDTKELKDSGMTSMLRKQKYLGQKSKEKKKARTLNYSRIKQDFFDFENNEI